ncbi:MAG: hypothetical protein IT236_05030 [Bacteroidia bacterium]|nr:hypothetical protein [Bacteroidia bacterium]
MEGQENSANKAENAASSEIKTQVNSNQNYSSQIIDGQQANASAWQKWLFAIGLACALLFFVVFVFTTLTQVSEVQSSISNSPNLNDTVLYNLISHAKPSERNDKIDMSLLLLENQIIKKRYHNANVILKAQIYTKYLGFLTGMILSLLGAMFILGKYRELPTDVKVQSNDPNKLNLQLQSTSPGIILSVIGAVIMITTILSKTDIIVKDYAIYLQADYSVNTKKDTTVIDTNKTNLTAPEGMIDRMQKTKK